MRALGEKPESGLHSRMVSVAESSETSVVSGVSSSSDGRGMSSVGAAQRNQVGDVWAQETSETQTYAWDRTELFWPDIMLDEV